MANYKNSNTPHIYDYTHDDPNVLVESVGGDKFISFTGIEGYGYVTWRIDINQWVYKMITSENIIAQTIIPNNLSKAEVHSFINNIINNCDPYKEMVIKNKLTIFLQEPN